MNPIMRNGGQLVIVGSGIAAISHFTLEAVAYIEDADHVFYHATNGATASYVRKINPRCSDLYKYYGEGKTRRITYLQMTEAIMHEVRNGSKVVGVFHGHPGVFVRATRQAASLAASEGFPVKILPGISSIDCLLADLRIDPSSASLQIIAAGHVLRGSELCTSAQVVLVQAGAVGDSSFSFSGYKNAKRVELFERLTELYGSDQEVVYYVASQLPTLEPVIIVRALREYADPEIANGIGTALIYIPPRGMRFDEFRSIQEGRSQGSLRERKLARALQERNDASSAYIYRQASSPMLEALLRLATSAEDARLYEQSPMDFVSSLNGLTPAEHEALITRDMKEIRAVMQNRINDES